MRLESSGFSAYFSGVDILKIKTLLIRLSQEICKAWYRKQRQKSSLKSSNLSIFLIGASVCHSRKLGTSSIWYEDCRRTFGGHSTIRSPSPGLYERSNQIRPSGPIWAHMREHWVDLLPNSKRPIHEPPRLPTSTCHGTTNPSILLSPYVIALSSKSWFHSCSKCVDRCKC